jgi:hypothetical protein
MTRRRRSSSHKPEGVGSGLSGSGAQLLRDPNGHMADDTSAIHIYTGEVRAFAQRYLGYIRDRSDLGHGTWRPAQKTVLATTICQPSLSHGWRSKNLQLHHLHYRNLGRETWRDLRPLCRWPCHAIVTTLARVRSTAAATWTLWASTPHRACRGHRKDRVVGRQGADLRRWLTTSVPLPTILLMSCANSRTLLTSYAYTGISRVTSRLRKVGGSSHTSATRAAKSDVFGSSELTMAFS